MKHLLLSLSSSLFLLAAIASAHLHLLPPEPPENAIHERFNERYIPTTLPTFITYSSDTNPGTRSTKTGGRIGIIVDTASPPEPPEPTAPTASGLMSSATDEGDGEVGVLDVSESGSATGDAASVTGTGTESSSASITPTTLPPGTTPPAPSTPSSPSAQTNNTTDGNGNKAAEGMSEGDGSTAPKHNVTGIAVGVVLAVLVLGGLGVWWAVWWKKQRDKKAVLAEGVEGIDMDGRGHGGRNGGGRRGERERVEEVEGKVW